MVRTREERYLGGDVGRWEIHKLGLLQHLRRWEYHFESRERLGTVRGSGISQ